MSMFQNRANIMSNKKALDAAKALEWDHVFEHDEMAEIRDLKFVDSPQGGQFGEVKHLKFGDNSVTCEEV